MGQISESYASPGLRLGLLLEDYPGATYTFEMVEGTDLNIPAEFGGESKFCVATIAFGDDRRAPVSAWKPVPARGNPDDWNVLCTKTLGRALKRAGYPDDVEDLKALVVWRKRNTEIAALSAGHPVPQMALPESVDPVQLALEAASTASPAGRVRDADDEVEAETLADPDKVATIVEVTAGMNARDRRAFDGFLDTIGAPEDPERLTESQADEILDWLDS